MRQRVVRVAATAVAVAPVPVAVAKGQIGSDLVVAVPLSSAEHVLGVARASVPAWALWQRVLAWPVLAGLAALSLLAANLVARRQARMISGPLGALSAASQRVAEVDLTARAGLSHIPEIHRVGRRRNVMVSRLTLAIEGEWHFSADASHQLRTPLTGFQLGLGSALQDPEADLPSVISHASLRVRKLHRTVDEVLALARLGPEQWLAMARSMAEARGGRILLTRASPATCTFILPGPPALPHADEG